MNSVITIFLITIMLCAAGCGENNNPDNETKAPSVSLQLAALQGNVEAVKQHINAGSDLNIIDEYGSTPLIIAITFGKTAAAKTLIEAGADLTIANKDGSTPLHLAAFFCRTEIVKALLEKGADKKAKNNFGSTPLQSIMVPFDAVKPVYDGISASLKTFGLVLDYERIKTTRPKIAELLK